MVGGLRIHYSKELDGLKEHKYSGDYNFRLLAEVYDQSETGIDDVELLERLKTKTQDALQERCIELADKAVRPGGKLYLDNNHWESPITQELGRKWTGHLEGVGSDGTYGSETAEVIGVEEENRVLHLKRTWYTRTPEGQEATVEYTANKRPIEGWLQKHGFAILKVFGSRSGEDFKPDSDRAIFWAERARDVLS